MIDLPFALPTVVAGDKRAELHVQRKYERGVITPGIGIAAEALFRRAARLRPVDIRDPGKVIGTNTTESTQSGLYYGSVSMVDGILDRMLAQLGKITGEISVRDISDKHARQVPAELRPLHARIAVREVMLDPSPDRGIALTVEEALDLTERLDAVGSAIVNRAHRSSRLLRARVHEPSPTTPSPALSFPGAAGTSRSRSACP